MTLLLVVVGYLVLLVGALSFNHGANREPAEPVEPMTLTTSQPVSAGLARSN